LGTHAAYVVGLVGSNANVHTCVFLAYQDSSGWHAYEVARCPLSTAFPVPGALGQVETWMGAKPTDCVDARSAPGAAGKVLSCVRNGTPIEIDGGPDWVAPPQPELQLDGFWWHVKGRGWMLNAYLGPR